MAAWRKSGGARFAGSEGIEKILLTLHTLLYEYISVVRQNHCSQRG